MGRGSYFNGRYNVVPGANSRIDVSALNAQRVEGDNVLFFIAEADGYYEPKVPILISDPRQARDNLHEATDLLDALGMCFNPSPDRPGCPHLYLVLANPATQASKTILQGVTNYAALKTRGYGAWTNNTYLKIETGTTASSKKVTTYFGDQVNVIDDIIRECIQVQYTGSAAACTLTIVQSEADPTLAKLTTAATAVPADNLDLALTTYDTLQKLVDAINNFRVSGTAKYTATVLSSRSVSSRSLDSKTAVDVKTAAIKLNADYVEFLNRINVENPWLTAEVVTGHADGLPDNISQSPLAGAVDGTATSDDWDDAFAAATSGWPHPDLVLGFTTSAAIHLLIDNFAQEQQCRAFVGTALQTTWGTAGGRTTALGVLTAAAKAVNSARTFMPGLGVRVPIENVSYFSGTPELNLTVLKDSRYTAALYAGLAAGCVPWEPLTFKHLRVVGLEAELTEAEVEVLLNGGVCPPWADPRRSAGWLISRQVSTHVSDDNLVLVEFSVGRTADWVAENVRLRHAEFIGLAGVTGIEQTIKRTTNAVLADALKQGGLVSFDPEATTVTVDNDRADVAYQMNVTKPINWVFSTGFVQPTYATTLTATFSVPLT